MRSFLNSKKFDYDFEQKEPANMVVALGRNPRDPGPDGEPKWAYFYEFIPGTKQRPKDGRSIILFDVELRVRPYVSPMSGGLAYRVVQNETTTKIQRPEDGCLYPPNLTHEIKWKLFEVHIGEDPETGPFVGVLMERDITSNLTGNDYEYFQWPGDKECPPLFYGWYPEGWCDIDPEYLKLHTETRRLAQIATYYEICDSPNCCVRFGCRNCENSVFVEADEIEPCHQTNKCANFNSYYDGILHKWLQTQSRAVLELCKKVRNPIPALIERTIFDTFREYMLDHIKLLKKSGFDYKYGLDFWMNWAQCKAQGISDAVFIDSWKIQNAKDKFVLQAVKAATEAEEKWDKILKERRESKPLKPKRRKKNRKNNKTKN